MARYATLPEAAAYLRMSERTMRRLRERGLVPSSNPTGGQVLFDLDLVDEWIEASADPRPSATTADELATAAKRKARNTRRRATSVPGSSGSARSDGPGRSRKDAAA